MERAADWPGARGRPVYFILFLLPKDLEIPERAPLRAVWAGNGGVGWLKEGSRGGAPALGSQGAGSRPADPSRGPRARGAVVSRGRARRGLSGSCTRCETPGRVGPEPQPVAAAEGPAGAGATGRRRRGATSQPATNRQLIPRPSSHLPDRPARHPPARLCAPTAPPAARRAPPGSASVRGHAAPRRVRGHAAPPPRAAGEKATGRGRAPPVPPRRATSGHPPFRSDTHFLSREK